MLKLVLAEMIRYRVLCLDYLLSGTISTEHANSIPNFMLDAPISYNVCDVCISNVKIGKN